MIDSTNDEEKRVLEKKKDEVQVRLTSASHNVRGAQISQTQERSATYNTSLFSPRQTWGEIDEGPSEEGGGTCRRGKIHRNRFRNRPRFGVWSGSWSGGVSCVICLFPSNVPMPLLPCSSACPLCRLVRAREPCCCHSFFTPTYSKTPPDHDDVFALCFCSLRLFGLLGCACSG